uniref:Cytochrome b6-f complex subunit 7 n=1 Tax=Anthurium amnicola TaxID=1678845 RepID=A0A1D1XUQ2_9ARAE
MAALLSPASPAMSCSLRRRRANDACVGELSPFVGLKAAHKSIASLGLPESADRSFSRVARSLRAASRGRGRGGGGALSSTCSAGAEIFKIAAIMNGLVLVGVAVGFVILRVEAWLEESDS